MLAICIVLYVRMKRFFYKTNQLVIKQKDIAIFIKKNARKKTVIIHFSIIYNIQYQLILLKKATFQSNKNIMYSLDVFSNHKFKFMACSCESFSKQLEIFLHPCGIFLKYLVPKVFQSSSFIFVNDIRYLNDIRITLLHKRTVIQLIA